MNWIFKKDSQFPRLTSWNSSQLRAIFDLQYASLLLAEQNLLKDIEMKNVLDFGAGLQDFKNRHPIHSYRSLDPYMPADWKNLEEISLDQSFGLIIALDVLEHLKEPGQTLNQLSRHQKKGDFLYLTTPFLAREHGAPDDYQRWTEAGLKSLVEASNYEVIRIIRRGNFLSSLSSQLNYWIARNIIFIKNWYIIPAIPIVFILFIVARMTLKNDPQTESYLGLSLLARKT